MKLRGGPIPLTWRCRRTIRRHPRCIVGIALLAVLLLDMYHVGYLMPHITYHHYRLVQRGSRAASTCK